MKNNSILAIIPARAGSKGLAYKNILDCAGKPLIAWTIEAAVKSVYVDHVLVSTDSEKISEIAKKFGADVPNLRPSKLAQDHSNIIDVVKDILLRLKNGGEVYNYLVLLQPTSPLRDSNCIDQAIEKYFSLKKTDLDTMISVKEIKNKILWALGENVENQYVHSHFGIDLGNTQRQGLPRCFLPNGAIYIAKVNNFCGFFGANTFSFLMDNDISIDVDNIDDLHKAKEYFFR